MKIGDSNRPLCKVATRELFIHNQEMFENICHFVVDEAQNFQNEPLKPDWFGQIQEILLASEGKKSVSLYLFCDKLQKHKVGKCGFFYLDESRRKSDWPFPFVERRFRTVIRNSKKIYKQWKVVAVNAQDNNSDCKEDHGSKHEQNDDLDVEIGHDYEGCDVIEQQFDLRTNEELAEKLSEVVTGILERKAYSPNDIAILFQTKDIATRMRDEMEKLDFKVSDSELFPRDGIVIDSVRRFGGLEAPVVIAVNYSATFFEDAKKLDVMLYSRAIVQLHLISTR